MGDSGTGAAPPPPEHVPPRRRGLVRRSGSVVWTAIRAFIDDQALTQSAALAFYTGLSLAPIVILLLWMSSTLGPQVQEQLIEQVAGLIGPQGGEVIRVVFENADADVDTARLAGWFSIGALLVSATGVFAQLQVALNAVWGVRSAPAGLGILAWLRKRLISLGLIVSFGFLLLVSLVVSSSLAALTSSLKDVLPGDDLLWRLLDLAIPLIVYVAMFMAVFRYLPDAELRWRHVWFGAVVTAVLFALGKSLIGLYLGTSALGSAYGATGSLILALMWTYYSAAIVLFGAEVTQAYVNERGERIQIEPHAEPDDHAASPRPTEPPWRGSNKSAVRTEANRESA